MKEGKSRRVLYSGATLSNEEANTVGFAMREMRQNVVLAVGPVSMIPGCSPYTEGENCYAKQP